MNKCYINHLCVQYVGAIQVDSTSTEVEGGLPTCPLENVDPGVGFDAY